MSRQRKTETWATLIRLLGKESLTLRQAAAELKLSFDQADYFRKQLTEQKLLIHQGGGAYDTTGKGEAFLKMNPPRDSPVGGQGILRGPLSESSEGQVPGNPPRDRPYLWVWSGYLFTSALTRLAPHLENNNPLGLTHRHQRTLELGGTRFTVQVSQGSRGRGTALFKGHPVVLLARDKWAVVDREHRWAERAIERAMMELDISLRTSPSWRKGPKAKRSQVPSPSGELSFAFPPEVQDALRGQPGFPFLTSPASQIDASGEGASWETEDLLEAQVHQELVAAWEDGRTPYRVLKLQEGYRQLSARVSTVERSHQEEGP